MTRTTIMAIAALLGVTGSGAATASTAEHLLRGSAPRSTAWRPSLLVREQRPTNGSRARPVLYVHGSTFPSALSIMFKLAGKSWADDLNDAGFDVFGLDFAGYGGSSRYPEVDGAGARGRADEAAQQIERAVRFILKETGAKRVSIIAHSWGTVATGRFAGAHPELVDKLVFFGPIAQREQPASQEPIPAYNFVTTDAQHARFGGGVPAGEAPVLAEADFPAWAQAYLDSDPQSRHRAPAAVKVPAGPDVDLDAAWSGRLPYNPALIRAPTLIVRGAWDAITTDADVAWLKHALSGSARVADVSVPRATHLMHLEEGRVALYAATRSFLAGHDPREAAVQAYQTVDRRSLFAVIFEVTPNPARQHDYLAIAGRLRPLVAEMPGFLMNERFRSRTRPGVLLSVSLWDDEKALIRWRTVEAHHGGQVEGRGGVLSDYHLRVGEVTAGSGAFTDRRLGWLTSDQTNVATMKALTLIDGDAAPHAGADCELFDHLAVPGRVATLCQWSSIAEAERHLSAGRASGNQTGAYAIRIIRDYGMTDRREAPQFMPGAVAPNP
jgi:pimeloyl-ACP methyl ester carboxylesterase/heme-degrading monooxygenase HmoA